MSAWEAHMMEGSLHFMGFTVLGWLVGIKGREAEALGGARGDFRRVLIRETLTLKPKALFLIIVLIPRSRTDKSETENQNVQNIEPELQALYVCSPLNCRTYIRTTPSLKLLFLKCTFIPVSLLLIRQPYSLSPKTFMFPLKFAPPPKPTGSLPLKPPDCYFCKGDSSGVSLTFDTAVYIGRVRYAFQVGRERHVRVGVMS